MSRIHTAFPESPGSAFQVAGYQIHYYALLILAGIIFAVWIASVRLKARGAEGAISLDIALFAVPFGIVGGRAFHVVTHWNDYFSAGKNPVSALYVWEGGLAIYGALIFGAVGAFVGARISGLRFLSYVDALAPGLILAQAVGRWGNYFNSELFGAPTTLPWGVAIPSTSPAYPLDLPTGTTDAPTLFEPTFLYESLWCLLGFALLLWIDRVIQPRWGKLFGCYLIFYSAGRYFIEGMRIDPSDIYFGLRTNQWMALLTIAGGIALIIIQNRRHPGIELSPYRAGYTAPVVEQKELEDSEYELDSALPDDHVAEGSDEANAIESVKLS